MKNSKIRLFYTTKQVCTNKNIIGNTSRSPLKPLLLMKALEGLGLLDKMEICSNFKPFSNDDFKIAHTSSYVEAFFRGEKPYCSSNGLPWSKELANSVRYTNSNFYNALLHAVLNPSQITYALVSGFHHAKPNSGGGFCTFSGQVIAAIKLYEEFGVSGVVLDLDGHRGNSIEDTRLFNPIINNAIPLGFNFAQLSGFNAVYHANLVSALKKIEEAVFEKKINYIMWCHGADSHLDDDQGGQVNTKYWIKCSETFFDWIKQMDEKLTSLGRKPLPVTLCLFGGYRKDDFGSVLSLHIKDVVTCMNILCGHKIVYKANVAPKTHSFQTEQWINDMPISLLKMIETAKCT